MSVEDLRRVAGYRVVQDARLTNSILAVVEGRRAFNDCKAANDGLMRIVVNKDRELEGMAKQLSDEQWYRDRAERKARRRGKVVGLLLPVSIGPAALLVLK